MQIRDFDYLVIGSGLAGLTYALKASAKGSVCVLTKAEVAEANTSYAQGGIAAAVGEADSWELHEKDTLEAGAGLCNPEAVRFLVQSAPDCIEWLTTLGARFDYDGVALDLGREGGHGMNRIVHHADKTGWEIETVVVRAVRKNKNITVLEHALVTELLYDGVACYGALAMTEGELGGFRAPVTMIATGGCGRLYQHTTNPSVATGDGIALASRVGAQIADMEFMQFHPTTLYHPQMRSFLITEAVRGAGGTLRNHLGTRFMYNYDPRLELAPRDIVSRSIVSEMARLSTWCTYLDTTHLSKEQLRREFPTVFERLASIGLEIHKDWIPVVPAQHYSCGGIVTDLSGKSSIRGMLASGEVARTGVHGANRLASNSLLEAIVFATAAANLPKESGDGPTIVPSQVPPCIQENESIRIRRALQKVMTTEAGILRSDKGLRWALGQVQSLTLEFEGAPQAPFSQHSVETKNLLVAGTHVVQGALDRRTNVGLHYNVDLVRKLNG